MSTYECCCYCTYDLQHSPPWLSRASSPASRSCCLASSSICETVSLLCHFLCCVSLIVLFLLFPVSFCFFFLLLYLCPLDSRHVIIVRMLEKQIPRPSRPLWHVTLLLLFVWNELHRRSATCHTAVCCSMNTHTHILWYMLEVCALPFRVCPLSKSHSLSTPACAENWK